MLRFKPAISQDVRREVGHAKLTSKHNIDDVSPCTRWWSTMLFLGDFAKRLMSGEPRFQPCADMGCQPGFNLVYEMRGEPPPKWTPSKLKAATADFGTVWDLLHETGWAWCGHHIGKRVSSHLAHSDTLTLLPQSPWPWR